MFFLKVDLLLSKKITPGYQADLYKTTSLAMCLNSGESQLLTFLALLFMLRLMVGPCNAHCSYHNEMNDRGRMSSMGHIKGYRKGHRKGHQNNHRKGHQNGHRKGYGKYGGDLLKCNNSSYICRSRF